jgi:hypothetical protein
VSQKSIVFLTACVCRIAVLIFSVDSFVGMAGLVTSDRILGRNDAEELRDRFEKCVQEEFSETDGRIQAFRSELTGLAVNILFLMKHIFRISSCTD